MSELKLLEATVFSIEKLKKALDDFSETMYKSTHIFIGHPSTLLKINLNDFNSNVWFISHQDVEEGYMVSIKHFRVLDITD